MRGIGTVVLVVDAVMVVSGAYGYFLGDKNGREVAIEDVRSGKSDVWKERCFESDRIQEAHEMAMAKADAAKNLAGVQVVVTTEVQKVIDKCLENGGVVDGVGGNGVVCLLDYKRN